MTRRVAVLYCEARGTYSRLSGIDLWHARRDARGYAGPDPVVAHPPCGPWGRLKRFCHKQDASLAPLAVAQVRRWGGVLEHPAWSTLWDHCRLPRPGELPDEHGGWTLEVRQVDFGHVAAKPTWLYIVGLTPSEVRPVIVPGIPTHVVNSSVAWPPRNNRPRATGRSSPLKECSRRLRSYTPEPFAHFLIALARSSRV